MKYKCSFPDCSYETNEKSLIEKHHVKPRELGGNNKNSRLLYFCKNHHAMIFVPESKHGQHSICTDDKIIIKNVYTTHFEDVLHYQNCANKKEYMFFLNTRKITDF